MPLLDVTPEKRLYLSVISEYDLPKAICELVDNAIDFGRKNNRQNLEIKISIDESRQTILIEDNAGGVPASDLGLLLSPGRTTNELSDRGIGYFGVGAKRAVIALAQDVTIQTRFKKEDTCKIHFDDDWINEIVEWELPYEISKTNITSNTTIIELFKLRSPVSSSDIETLKTHLAEVYAHFIQDGVNIYVGRQKIASVQFDHDWAFPDGYEPTSFSDKIEIDDREVDVEIISGLIDHSGDPDNSYGVFFYCNDRMISKGLTDFSVGFEVGKVGNPHYNISLIRTIVKLKGQSRDMPWNSSKSGVDTKHPTFQKLRSSIINATTNYAKVCRSLQGKWDEEVFPYTEGDIIEKAGISVEHIPKNFLPKPPASKPRWPQRLVKANKKVVNNKVWVEGLQDSIIAADGISKMHLTQKNRVALIVLDSTLEIAFKEYLVNEKNIGMAKFAAIAKNRTDVQAEVFKHITVKSTVEQQINHYYRLRNDLVHQRATPNVSDKDITAYRKIVEDMLRKMFGLRFKV
jgi:anti-sigma regulatory factor (Ser/Thr protein kinase)